MRALADGERSESGVSSSLGQKDAGWKRLTGGGALGDVVARDGSRGGSDGRGEGEGEGSEDDGELHLEWVDWGRSVLDWG